MILVLSISDLLVVILGHPAVVLTAVTWSTGSNSSAHWSTSGSKGYHLAEVATIVSNYTQSFSMAALLTMTIDRYMAITRPFFHKVYVTKLRLLALAVTMDFLIIGVRMFRFFEDLKAIHYTTALLISITVFLLFAFMNYRMFRIASNVKRNEQATKIQSALLKKNSTCLLAVACFFLSIIPVVVYVVLRATTTGLISEDTLMLLRLWQNTMLTMSSTWNCVIFFWRNEILRNEGRKLLSGYMKFRRGNLINPRI
jgi:hypothetical protein